LQPGAVSERECERGGMIKLGDYWLTGVLEPLSTVVGGRMCGRRRG